MMSWKIPSLEHPPAPKAPRFILWAFLMVMIGMIGFGISLYLSINEILPTTMSNTELIVLFAILPALAAFLIRIFIYSLSDSHYQRLINTLDEARQEWRYWAGEHLGVLTHTRLAQLDEEHKAGEELASLPPNKDNVLTLNALKSLPTWEKQEKVIQQLLAPMAKYYHQQALTQPITVYWQSDESEADWTALIQYEASCLSLPLESVEILPDETVSQWLLGLYENRIEPKLYAILAFQLGSTVSEEAASLLLAPQQVYAYLRAPIKAKLLRPISTDIESFADTLKTQCEFQHEGKQLGAIWHSGVKASDKGKCIENYVVQGVPHLSEHLHDIDTLLGKGGMARYVVALSLICEYPHYNLVIYQDKSNMLLQQIQV